MSEVFYIVNDMKVDPNGKPVETADAEEKDERLSMKLDELKSMALEAGNSEEGVAKVRSKADAIALIDGNAESGE